MTLTLTPGSVVAAILAVAAFITCVSGAITVLVNFYNKLKEPKEDIQHKISNHDTVLEDHTKKIDLLLDSNKVSQKALFALLEHAIDGNNVDRMKQAKEDLNDFLINH